MKFPRLRTILLTPLVLFLLFYLYGVYVVQTADRSVEPRTTAESQVREVAIFGASGTAGDGILKAAMASDDISKIYVVTRRLTPRMEEGTVSGKVKVIKHLDYLDYSAFIERLSEINTVYWAIGITSIGTDEQTYRMIHTDFPLQFLTEWTAVNNSKDLAFHFISSSDISEDSDTMWIREKIHAEKVLFGFADNKNLKVFAYRPDYIGPTDEEAHLGQDLLYWFFAPVGAAVKAREIGQAMLEISARSNEFTNGDKFSTWKILKYSDAYAAQKDD